MFGKSNHSTCIVHFNVTTVIRLLLLWSSDIKGPCGASSVNVTVSQASFPFLFLLGAEVLTAGSMLKDLLKFVGQPAWLKKAIEQNIGKLLKVSVVKSTCCSYRGPWFVPQGSSH